MSNQLVFLKEWFKKRSARDRLYLYIGGFFFLYFIYFIFVHRSVSAQKTNLIQSIAALQLQQITIQQQIDNIKGIIKTPIFLQMITEQKRLTLQLDKMQQQLDSLKPALSSAEEMPMVTKKILNQQRNNVILISLEELPIEPWPPKDMVDKSNLLKTVSGYQHILQMEFQNDYFSTIDYLKHLEEISQHMYWDSMDYKVLQYPKADVVIKFHVLSLQKS
jgi:MSHA biogenesis protein MshJ